MVGKNSFILSLIFLASMILFGVWVVVEFGFACVSAPFLSLIILELAVVAFLKQKRHVAQCVAASIGVVLYGAFGYLVLCFSYPLSLTRLPLEDQLRICFNPGVLMAIWSLAIALLSGKMAARNRKTKESSSV